MKKMLIAAALFLAAGCGKESEGNLTGTSWELVGTERRAVITFIDDDDMIQRVYYLDGEIDYTVAATYTYNPPTVTLHNADGSAASAKVAGDMILFREENGETTVWNRISLSKQDTGL
jgi:hypothetical protein